jgi:hypothetical protein
MVPIEVSWEALDLCDGTARVALVGVTSSEPEDAPGSDDGATHGDVAGLLIGQPDDQIQLRAERDGRGPGRTYEIRYQATDSAGNATPAVAAVTVPHDLGAGPDPLQLNVETTAAGTRVYWPAVDGALAYDAISGDLQALRLVGETVSLGQVRVLGRALQATSVLDSAGAPPPPGRGFFYLVQPRTARGGLGYGTESVPWPYVPSGCDGGCP